MVKFVKGSAQGSMRPVFVCALLGVFACLSTGIQTASAQSQSQMRGSPTQLEFRTGYRGHTFVYHYQWLDVYNKTQSMSFELKKKMAQTSNKEFQRFDSHAQRNYVIDALKRYRPQNRKLTVKFVFEGGGFAPQFEGRFITPAEVDQEYVHIKSYVKRAQEEFVKQSLHKNYDRWGLLPDYAELTKLYTPRVEPVAAAILKNTQGQSPREKINYTLGFLQSIPYDQLLNRENSNGSGYATPVELFSRNIADCDSKSVAFLSILRNIFPQTPMALILVPGHAFVGMYTAPEPGDVTVMIEGEQYVMAEPVGPGRSRMGQLQPESLKAIQNGDYTYIRVR